MSDFYKITDKSKKLYLPPAFTVFISFALLILLGSALLILPVSRVENISYTDALFTAASAVCVSGLSVSPISATYSVFGQTVILLLVQLGGLGFMTVATLLFIFLGKKISLKERLILSESFSEDSLQGVLRLTLKIALYTFIAEAVGAVLLSFAFVPDYGAKGIFYAIFHSVTAFCNSGLDLTGDSLAPYKTNPLVILTVCALIASGGLGFTVMNEISQKRSFKRLSLTSKIVLITNAALILISVPIFFISEYFNPLTGGNQSFGVNLLNAVFYSFTGRSAGFYTYLPQDMSAVSLFWLTINMFIGAAPGSTGGGIKVTTFFVLILVLISSFKGRHNSALVMKKRIGASTVFKTATVIAYSLTALSVSVFLILIAQKANLAEIFPIIFEVFSAFNTVGISMGITSGLTVMSKIVIVFTMLAGRVGILAVGLFASPKSGIGGDLVEYPEEKITIG